MFVWFFYVDGKETIFDSFHLCQCYTYFRNRVKRKPNNEQQILSKSFDVIPHNGTILIQTNKKLLISVFIILESIRHKGLERNKDLYESNN